MLRHHGKKRHKKASKRPEVRSLSVIISKKGLKKLMIDWLQDTSKQIPF